MCAMYETRKTTLRRTHFGILESVNFCLRVKNVNLVALNVKIVILTCVRCTYIGKIIQPEFKKNQNINCSFSMLSIIIKIILL